MNTEKKTLLQENINCHLKEAQISPEQLDKKALLSLGTVRNILSGRSRDPRGHTISSIARALNMSVEELRGDTKSTNNSNEDIYDIDLEDTVNMLVNEYIKDNKVNISAEKARRYKKILYNYSQTTQRTIDKGVVKWYLKEHL
jgi:transcriptional regulator with XRE-family HTH domain